MVFQLGWRKWGLAGALALLGMGPAFGQEVLPVDYTLPAPELPASGDYVFVPPVEGAPVPEGWSEEEQAAKDYLDRRTYSISPEETLPEAAARYRRISRDTTRWEIIAVVVGPALDIATTQIGQSRGAREINPIYGSHASVGEQLLFNAITGAWKVWTIERNRYRYPEAALRQAKIHAAFSLLPGVVNLRVVF